MASPPTGLARMNVEWERLVRKALAVAAARRDREPSEKPTAYLGLAASRLGKVPGGWDRTQWVLEAAQSSTPGAAGMDSARKSMAALAMACAQGNSAAMAAAGGDASRNPRIAPAPHPAALAAARLSHSPSVEQGGDAGRGRGAETSRPRGSISDAELLGAVAQGVALGHQATRKPLMPWLAAACHGYARRAYASRAAAALDPASADGSPSAGIPLADSRSLIAAAAGDPYFMDSLFIVPPAALSKAASQHKTLDGSALHWFARSCAACALVEPHFFSDLLGRGLDSYGSRAAIEADHARFILSGEILRQDLATSIERGLQEGDPGGTGRGDHHVNTEIAARLLAQTIGRRGIRPHDGEDLWRTAESPGQFRHALASSLEAFAIEREAKPAPGPLRGVEAPRRPLRM